MWEDSGAFRESAETPIDNGDEKSAGHSRCR